MTAIIAVPNRDFNVVVDTFGEHETVFYRGPESLPDIRLKSAQEKITWHHAATFDGRHKGISAYHFHRDYVVLDGIVPVGHTRYARIERWWIVNLCPDESRRITAVGRSIREAYDNAWRAYRQYLQDQAVQS